MLKGFLFPQLAALKGFKFPVYLIFETALLLPLTLPDIGKIKLKRFNAHLKLTPFE